MVQSNPQTSPTVPRYCLALPLVGSLLPGWATLASAWLRVSGPPILRVVEVLQVTVVDVVARTTAGSQVGLTLLLVVEPGQLLPLVEADSTVPRVEPQVIERMANTRWAWALVLAYRRLEECSMN